MRHPCLLTTGLALLAPLATLSAQRDTVRLDPNRLPESLDIRARVLGVPSVRITNGFGSAELFAMEIVPGGFAFDSARGLNVAHMLAFNEGYRLDIRHSRTSHGAVIGALVVGVPAALAGIVMGGLACIDYEGPGTCQAVRLDAALLVGVPGAVVGALLGGIVGSKVRTWHGIWQSHPD